MDFYSTLTMGDFMWLFANIVLANGYWPQKALRCIGQFICICRPLFTFDEWTEVSKVTIVVVS